MISTGSQRGGARQLAGHLLSQDNDHVTVHEVKGFATSDLTGAFVEAHAISKATYCRQFLFSLSLSPPPEETVSTKTFEKAIEDVEQKQERAALKEKQDKRAQEDQAQRQALYRKGIKGLKDRLTGRHARLKSANEHALLMSLKRDQDERDDLIFRHIEARERLTLEKADVLENYQMVRNALLAETAQSQQAKEQEPERLRQLHRRSRDNGLGR